MSIEQQKKVAELEQRVAALEQRLPLPEATTQELCDALQKQLDDRKTLTLPKKRANA